ncbi:MAG: inositol monophosphatase [Deltaproteobacteria bacterium]|nr:inositol monophosphatase [Deltaproteobacteria bacterium]
MKNDEILKLALKAAEQAGEIMSHYRYKHEISAKSSRYDIVTTADIEAEKAIVETIKSHFPEHQILAEENHKHTQDLNGPLWVIDPIDGTVNYAHGHHHTCTSIAFLDKGITQVGVVYCPFLNEKFTAIKGQGAYLNDQKIKTTDCTEIANAIVATGFPYVREQVMDTILANIRTLMENARGIRRFGAAALDTCWVACGRLDAFFEFSLEAWDMAAGSLIASEAGAVVGHISGHVPNPKMPAAIDSENYLVSTKGLFDFLQTNLRARPA